VSARQRWWVTTLIAALTLAPSITVAQTPTPTREPATVLRITDGDTIRVLFEGSPTSEPVRYLCVDTPETGTPFAQQATDANRQLVDSGPVWLERDVRNRDQYDRLLRYVFTAPDAPPEQSVNAELVRRGLAQVYRFDPDVKYCDLFQELQQFAQLRCRGMWGSLGCFKQYVPVVSARMVWRPAPPFPATPSPVPTAAATMAPPATGNLLIAALNCGGAPEEVQIENRDTLAVELEGWEILSVEGEQHFFFPAYTLAPAASVFVHSGSNAPLTGGNHFRWSGRNIWNNAGDEAQLRTPVGTVVDQAVCS
jgi:endonuclease YncB( thermonuclease family)